MKHKRSLTSVAVVALVISLCAVFASTSVSAGVSSSANAITSDPTRTSVSAGVSNSATAIDLNLAGTSVSAGVSSSATATISKAVVQVAPPYGMVGAPGVDGRVAHEMDLFVRGTDGNIWWRTVTSGVWTAWKNIGHPSVGVTSSPDSAAYSAGGVLVTVRGGDGACWYKYTPDGGTTWYGWLSEGGQILAGTGPTAWSMTSGSVSFAVTGTNHALYWWTGASWKGLGGYLTSSPSGTKGGTNYIDLKGRGSNGACWYIDSSDGGSTWFTGWRSLGGGLLAGTNPTSALTPTGGSGLGTGVTGTNGAIYWWSGSSWKSLGGGLTSSPDCESAGSGDIVLVARGAGVGDPWARESVSSGSTWASWLNLSLY